MPLCGNGSLSSTDQKVKATKSSVSKENSDDVFIDTTNATMNTTSTVLAGPSIVMSGVPRAEVTCMPTKVIVNELLSYVHFYRDNSNGDALRRAVLGFYSAEDISEAKKLLVQEFRSNIGSLPCLTERRNSTTRLAHEAETDDILGVFDALDAQSELAGYLFVASNLGQVPKFGPEEMNIGAVVDRQVRMESAIQELTANVNRLTSTHAEPDSRSAQAVQPIMQDIRQQMHDVSTTINQRLDHLNTVCSKLAEAATVTVSNSPHTTQPERDKSLNIVMFGVAEDRAATVWRRTVDDVLHHVTGRSVDVVDVFRIGRFVSGKVRPVIVRLRTVWDRRIILGNCYKLKDFGSPVFIVPDETLEVRRKRMLERIKGRAENDGKSVTVVDGVLLVDDVPVFFTC